MAVIWDGFSTYLTFGDILLDSGAFRIKEIKPIGVDGGGPIQITHMKNIQVRTQVPKFLVTIQDMDMKVEYDPVFMFTYLQYINVNTFMTLLMPDKSNLTFYGWINKVDPETNTEGNLPLANVQVCVSNINSGSLSESAPTYNDPEG